VIVVHFYRAAWMAAVVACALPFAACGGPPTGPDTVTPVVSSIAPSRGPSAGGTRVRIAGNNFAAGAAVSIGGVAAIDVVVESGSAILATTPPHAGGIFDVTVTVAGRSGVLASAFTFEAPTGEPPVIAAIAARGTRLNEPANFADLGEEIAVTASVQDPDTPSDQLTFEWTGEAGSFSGSGASVKWRAPAAAVTPLQVKLTVTVSDRTSNRVSASTAVRLHDSAKEVGDLAREFLLDFSDSTKTPVFVMRNFSTGDRCASERADELADVEKNRRFYLITASTVGAAAVNVQFASRPCTFAPVPGDACAAVPVLWDSRCLVTNDECKAGDSGRASGVDHVTAVYEQSQWRLCASHFKGTSTFGPSFIR
jgi:hypothetical protein